MIRASISIVVLSLCSHALSRPVYGLESGGAFLSAGVLAHNASGDSDRPSVFHILERFARLMELEEPYRYHRNWWETIYYTTDLAIAMGYVQSTVAVFAARQWLREAEAILAAGDAIDPMQVQRAVEFVGGLATHIHHGAEIPAVEGRYTMSGLLWTLEVEREVHDAEWWVDIMDTLDLCLARGYIDNVFDVRETRKFIDEAQQYFSRPPQSGRQTLRARQFLKSTREAVEKQIIGGMK